MNSTQSKNPISTVRSTGFATKVIVPKRYKAMSNWNWNQQERQAGIYRNNPEIPGISRAAAELQAANSYNFDDFDMNPETIGGRNSNVSQSDLSCVDRVSITIY